MKSKNGLNEVVFLQIVLPPFLETSREFCETYTTESRTEATLMKSKNGFNEVKKRF